MKTKRVIPRVIALAVVVFSLLGQAAFSFPFTEAFNYPQTNLGYFVTNLDPEGNAWFPCGTNVAGGGTNDVQVTNFTLTYPGLLCPATNSVYFQSSGYTERLAVAPAVVSTNTNSVVSTNNFNMTSGTLYYSFIFTITNLNGNSGAGGFVCGFNNTVGAQGTQPSIVDSRLYIRPSSLGISGPYGFFGYEMGMGKATPSPVNANWSTNQYASMGGAFPASTNFIVASYTFVGGVSNDVSQIWINPSTNTYGAGSAPTPDFTNNIGPNISGIQTFMFRQGNSQVPSIIASDLRVGTNWSDVTPSSNTNATPPPPSPVPLSVVMSGGNAVISWTTNNSTGLRLEGTASLITGSNAWTNVTAPTNVVGTNYTVNDPITGKNYYRLIYP